MQKKGQVSFYVVTGIVIMALIILTVANKDKLFGSEWDEQQQKAMLVPQRVESLNKFVLSCIEKTANDGATIMGLQGGYINVPEGDLPLTSNNPFSNSLRIFPNQEYETVYWNYKSANGIFKNQIPAIERMENELAGYIDSNLASCTLNFTLYEEFNVSSGPIKTEVQIKSEKVLVTVDYPIYVQVGQFSFNFPDFYQSINVNLGRFYEKAKEVAEKMDGDYFLEEITLDILSLNENIPYSETESSCVPKFWNVMEIETSLKEDLELNIPHIKIKGTDFSKRNDYFVWDALSGFDKDFHVGMRYSGKWPMELEVFPSDNGILVAEPFNDPKAKELAYVTPFLCLLDYNFIYDIKYPVLIIFSDDDGFVFQFASQVVIDNNQPKENILGTENFESSKPIICENAIKPITVYALDAGTYKTVDNVEIKIKCVSTVCQLGKTEYRLDGESKLFTKSPACVNGFLIADKKGYHTGKQIVDTTEETQFSVLLDEFRELDYEIKLVEKSGLVRDPTDDENVILILNEDEKEYNVNLLPEYDNYKIKLIPGTYDFQAQVASESDEGFYIESKTIEKCVDAPKQGFWGAFLGFEEEHCYSVEMPSIKLDYAITGGTNFEWAVYSQDLDTFSKIIFYVPVKDPPKTQEDVARIMEEVETGTTVFNPEWAI